MNSDTVFSLLDCRRNELWGGFQPGELCVAAWARGFPQGCRSEIPDIGGRDSQQPETAAAFLKEGMSIVDISASTVDRYLKGLDRQFFPSRLEEHCPIRHGLTANG